jgi:hypothetical protein
MTLPVKPDGGFHNFTTAVIGQEAFVGIGDKIVKYDEPSWYRQKDRKMLPSGVPYAVTELYKYHVLWPPETGPGIPPLKREEVPPDVPFDLDTRNAATPKDQWRKTKNKDRDGNEILREPWVAELQVYLETADGEQLIFVTETVGGRVAVEKLAEKVNRERARHDGREDLRVIVTLDNARMTAQKNPRGFVLRPEFTYLGNVARNEHGKFVPLPDPPLSQEIKDAIPW